MAKATKVDVDFSAATIGKMIDEIKTASESIKSKLSHCAMLCIVHDVVHGNSTPCLNLLKAISASDGDKAGATPWRTNALKAWFIEKGTLVQVETEVDGKKVKELKGDAAKRAKLKPLVENEASFKLFTKDLRDNPFWLFKPEPAFEGFDFDKELKALIAKGKRTAKKHEGSPKVTLGHLTEIESFLAMAPAANALAV